MSDETVAPAPAAPPPSLAPDAPAILVVDDEPSNLESLERIFAREGLRTLLARDGQTALEHVRRERVGVVLTDLSMPGMSGTDLLKGVKAISPDTEVVVMTAYGTVEVAVGAMKEGAYDFITKPFKRHVVVAIVRKALERQSLVLENQVLKARLEGLGNIVGASPAFRATMDLVRQAAPSEATVLLLGESGTGKELVARLIHSLSTRARGEFVAINCAAIPESILESELFGYERGAFTNAVSRKEGRIERAHGGTLFLDEIGELSPTVQVKLLRVLQEGEIERLGGHTPIRVDARVVAATNKDLQEQVEKGQFREDLFYRLNVITVQLPPLRARREDVPLLAGHFLRIYAERNKKPVSGMSRAALDVLENYPWPGNVRELQHAIERAVVLTRNETLGPEDFEAKIRGTKVDASPEVTFKIGSQTMDELEHRIIRDTVRFTKDDKTLAAQLLGISVRTIYRKLDPSSKE
jgi:two-component system response regulator HydG